MVIFRNQGKDKIKLGSDCSETTETHCYAIIGTGLSLLKRNEEEETDINFKKTVKGKMQDIIIYNFIIFYA